MRLTENQRSVLANLRLKGSSNLGAEYGMPARTVNSLAVRGLVRIHHGIYATRVNLTERGVEILKAAR